MLNRLDDYPIHQTSEPIAHLASSDPNVYDRTWFNGYSDDGSRYFGFGMAVYPHLLGTHLGDPGSPTGPLATATQGDDCTRFAQFGRWTGTVSHPDGEFTVDSETWRGTKDRSWGIRGVGERVRVGAPQRPGSAFFLWAPLQWDDHITHAVFFDGPKGEALVREGLASPLYDSEGEIPEELDDVTTRLATAVHRIDDRPGTRWARHAELDLIDLYGNVRTITMQPQLRFQFKGLGYGHPRWSQGSWQGELEVAGESFDPLELDPLAPENIHIQQVVKVTDGERTGIGALEQIVVGPYEPAGFTEAFDGAEEHDRDR